MENNDKQGSYNVEVVAPHGSALAWNIKNCIVRASEGETSNKNNVLNALFLFYSDTCVLVSKLYLASRGLTNNEAPETIRARA